MFQFDCPLCGDEVTMHGSSSSEGADIYSYLCPKDGAFAIPFRLDMYLKHEATPEELKRFKEKVSASATPYFAGEKVPQIVYFYSID
ncbi:hypothetical protein MUU49_19515 [Scandinavium goeteborgense]|uniref:hypothetical protein n=1 Tax=Scandinavium goeteborgense TaxID=1851514 RepID=UPI002166B028|nr:hypothetical protein [Scandinavium goeteborgense]MCS2154744.1 hypothetical protein [Scandinavium goeteborgense]